MRPGSLLITCVLLGGAAGEARGAAASAEGDLFVGGGVDTNPFLQVAATPQSPLYRDASNVPFARLMPVVRAHLASEKLRLDLRYDGDLRWLAASGHALYHQGALGLTLPELGRFSLGAALLVGRYDDAWKTSAEVHFIGAGMRAEASARLAPEIKLTASYRYERRFFQDVLTVDSDSVHMPDLRLSWRPTPAGELGLFVDSMILRSRGNWPQTSAAKTVELGVVKRLHAGVDAWRQWSPNLTVAGAFWAGREWTVDDTTSPATSGRGVQFGAVLSAQYVLTEWLDAALRVATFFNRAADPARDWTRHLLSAGLVAHGRVPRRLPDRGDETMRFAPVVSARAVTFRFHGPAAASVKVIGSWNDWETEAPQQTLHRAPGEPVWQATVATGPGEHRYRFVVDGVVMRPDDAPQYRTDDFGGEDGVVSVP